MPNVSPLPVIPDWHYANMNPNNSFYLGFSSHSIGNKSSLWLQHTPEDHVSECLGLLNVRKLKQEQSDESGVSLVAFYSFFNTEMIVQYSLVDLKDHNKWPQECLNCEIIDCVITSIFNKLGYWFSNHHIQPYWMKKYFDKIWVTMQIQLSLITINRCIKIC